MGTQEGRRRSNGGAGSARWVVLGVASVVVLVATFVLGVAAGRRAIIDKPPRSVAEPSAPRSAPAPRRSGLVEVGPEQHVPPLRDKLTFYQTLKAPMSAESRPGLPAPARAGEERVRTAAGRAHEQPRTVRTDVAAASVVTTPVSARSSATAETAPPGAEWTVQVGVFRTAQAAEGVKRQLALRGFAAQIAPVAMADGPPRYRVRVGSFGTRDDALRTADRVRSDPSLPTYVTTK